MLNYSVAELRLISIFLILCSAYASLGTSICFSLINYQFFERSTVQVFGSKLLLFHSALLASAFTQHNATPVPQRFYAQGITFWLSTLSKPDDIVARKAKIFKLC